MAGSNVVTLANNQGAGTYGPFNILGGQYKMLARSASWGGGNIALQVMDPQGGWVPISNGQLSANGDALLQLVSGQYQAVITTTTSVYSSLVTVPTITTR